MEKLKIGLHIKIQGTLGLICIASFGLIYSTQIIPNYLSLGILALGIILFSSFVYLLRKNLKQTLSTRAFKMGFISSMAITAAIAIALFVGALAIRHHARFDLTKNKVHSLAPQTIKVLKDLDKNVKAYAFFRNGQQGKKQALDLLRLYNHATGNFTFEFVDLNEKPGLAQRLRVKDYGTTVLLAGDKQEKIPLPEERALTNALIRILRGKSKTVYFILGHGEHSLEDIGKQGYLNLKKALVEQDYKVKTLVLATSSKLPQNASVLIIAGAQKNLMPQEKAMLDNYLNNGGRILLLLEPNHDLGLKSWLLKKGVVINQDLVLDPASKLLGGSPAWPTIMDYGFHPITDPLQNTISFFPISRSVSLPAQMPKGIKGVELIKTGNEAWAELDMSSLQKGHATFDKEKDVLGPISLGVAVNLPSKDSKKSNGRLIVFGDSSFADNNNLGQAGNRDLIMNSVNFLAEEEDLISLSAKSRKTQPLLLKASQAKLVFWVPVVIIPGIFMLLGAIVLHRRRRIA